MKALKAILFSAVLFFCPSVFSQTTKIVQINTQTIIVAMPELADAQTKLEEYRQELVSIMETMTVEYNKLLEAYANEQENLSEVAKSAKTTELSDKQARAQEFQQNAPTNLQNRQAELMQPIIEKVNKAIEEVAKEQNITWVFDLSQGSIAYSATNAPDITQDVLKKLGIQPQAQ